MPVKPFRFGVIAEEMTTAENWIAKAHRAEELGYSTLLVRDHFAPDYFGPQFAPIAAMTAAAHATTTLRVGTMVIDNDFRHPALLAKEAATLDLLSGGRLELGIGAGWLETEYRQTGIAYDPPGVRIGRMMESIEIIKACFSGEPVHFCGTHYQIDGLVTYPRPAQRPGPPLFIGGGGKRILTYAGKEADIVGILTVAVGTGVVVDDPRTRIASRVAEQIGWVLAGAGARFDQVELSMVASVTITGDRHGAARAAIASHGWSGITAEQVWDMPAVLIGTVPELVDQLRLRRDRLGFSYVIVDDASMEQFAPVVAALSNH